MAGINGNEKKTSPALITLAWVLVGLPLSWGVYRSALNAVKLFQAQTPLTIGVSASPGQASPRPASKP